MITGLKKLKNLSAAAKRNKLKTDASKILESKESTISSDSNLIINSTPVTNVKTEAIKFRTDMDGFVQLSLHVKPGSKVSRVAEITEKYIGLQVKLF